MAYELYIDIFFVVNSMLNVLVVRIARRVLRFRSSTIRQLLAAMAGSVVLCLFVCIPVRKILIAQIIGYVVAFLSMTLIAFPGNERNLFKSVTVLYGTGIMVNGMYHWLSVEVNHAGSLLAASVAVDLIVNGCYDFYRSCCRRRDDICDVTIFYHSHAMTMKGLRDTGNRLRSPYHQKGVSVVNYVCVRPFLEKDLQQCVENMQWTQENAMKEGTIFFIPYETVSSKHMLMPVIMAERLVIETEGETLEYGDVLLGLSKEPVSTNDRFRIILTADMAR